MEWKWKPTSTWKTKTLKLHSIEAFGAIRHLPFEAIADYWKLRDNTGARNRYSLNLITTAVDDGDVCACTEHPFNHHQRRSLKEVEVRLQLEMIYLNIVYSFLGEAIS
jgi:hypothetical protein